jgi:hypothetical protein
MHYCLEFETSHGIDIIPGCYFETAILLDNAVLHGTEGRDEFQFNGLLLPHKRIAGFGRRKTYLLTDFPAGLSACEAAPSESFNLDIDRNVAIKVTTNVMLDHGLLAHYLILKILKDNQPFREIPLHRPDIMIDWQSRGNFVITLGQL